MTIYKTIAELIEQLMEARRKDDTDNVLVFLCEEGKDANWNVICYEDDYPEEGHVFVAEFDCKSDAELFCLAANTIPDLHRQMKELVGWLEGEIEHDKGVTPEYRRHGSYGYTSLQEVLNKIKGAE